MIGLLLIASLAFASEGRYRIQVEPEVDLFDWNTFHAWRIEVRKADGGLPDLLEVRFDGRMPAHKHGFAVQPKLVDLGGGVYRAEGVRFHMTGDWEIEVGVRDAAGWEKAVRPFSMSRVAYLDKIRSLWIGSLGPPPADSGNRIAELPRAAALGRRLFFDGGLSGNGKVSCATCHDPSRYFTDGLRFSKGIGRPARHTPTLVGVSYSTWFDWDGRRDSLWSQALGPLESPLEMGSSRRRIAAYLGKDKGYRAAFQAVFGSDPATRPASETFANTGKAIAAYERTLRPKESRFDRFAASLLAGKEPGPNARLSAMEQSGLKVFLSERSGCLRCHNGPLFTNQQFHNIGTGLPIEAGAPPDFGRLVGLQALNFDEFRCGSPASDAKDCPASEFAGKDNHGDLLEGAFKVPGLRQVGATAPYFHDGRFSTLKEVLRHYQKPPQGRHELTALPRLSDGELLDLEAFLRTLDGN